MTQPSNQIEIHGKTGGFNAEQFRLLTDFLMKGATPDEIAVFAQVCSRTKLDPFRKQIHAVQRWSNQDKRYIWTYQTGIDGYAAIAHRDGRCAGIDDPVFVPQDESAEYPVKATVTVWKLVNGTRVPFTASARWKEYVQTTKDGSVNSMWRKMPYGQLGKCATALALRKAFPEELGGIYTDVEMEQADNHEQPVEAPARASVATEPEEIPESEPPPPPARRRQAPVQEAEVVSETTPTPKEPTDEEYSLAEAREAYANNVWREFPVPQEFGIEADILEKVKTSKERDMLYAKATGDLRLAVDNMMMVEIAARVANTGITIEEWEEQHGQRCFMPTTRLITHIHNLRQKNSK